MAGEEGQTLFGSLKDAPMYSVFDILWLDDGTVFWRLAARFLLLLALSCLCMAT